MPRYAITERAGPFVAAHRNSGVGTVLELTERQAEHELRLGTLVPLPVPDVRTGGEPEVTLTQEPLVQVQPPASEGEASAARRGKPRRSAPHDR
jgi:hypothetical protein